MFFRGLFLSLLSLFILLTRADSALASGSNTNTATRAGQVRVLQDGTTLYLTTDVNGNSTWSATLANNQAPTNSRFFGFNFDPRNLPEGFFTDPETLITDAINIIFIIAIILAFFYLIWAGFDWILSGGDKGKIDGARQKIINVVIGLIVVAASYAILTLTLQFLGYDSLQQAMTEGQQRIAR
jgi:heme A synthase